MGVGAGSFLEPYEATVQPCGDAVQHPSRSRRSRTQCPNRELPVWAGQDRTGDNYACVATRRPCKGRCSVGSRARSEVRRECRRKPSGTDRYQGKPGSCRFPRKRGTRDLPGLDAGSLRSRNIPGTPRNRGIPGTVHFAFPASLSTVMIALLKERAHYAIQLNSS